MQEPQAAQASFRLTGPRQFGNIDRTRITNQNNFRFALSIDQQTYLASDFMTEKRELTGLLVGEPVGVIVTAVRKAVDTF
ncbi:hypothetical protein [Maridesulfovibrio sp.]|uniref:hypothetical protein n=1 Tax=Maridesulfovibrio sp. TaxID=2795000 RepID=UPI002AA84216|nr:hypothetical protein [Maridesulfovibrio sp.]